jgi:hypothetical protein
MLTYRTRSRGANLSASMFGRSLSLWYVLKWRQGPRDVEIVIKGKASSEIRSRRSEGSYWNYDDVLGFCAVLTRRQMLTFRRNILSPSSGLKMKTVCFSETIASTDESTWRQNPVHHHDSHRRENLKSHSVAVNFRNLPQFHTAMCLSLSQERHLCQSNRVLRNSV